MWNKRASAVALMLSVVALAGVLLVAAAADPPAARADPWGACTTDTGCTPDSVGHTWCLTDSTSGKAPLRESMRWAVETMDAQTVMTENENTSCGGATDVRWRDVNLGLLTLGDTHCIDGVFPVCSQANVTVNVASIEYIADDPDDDLPLTDGIVEDGEVRFNRDLTACHELGHSFGLTHHELGWYADHANDCMVNPWRESELANNGWRKYNEHHRDDVAQEMS